MERKASQQHLHCLILASLFAAMIYVLTAYVHIPTHQGYIHVGDGVIYLAAALLPMPYAMGAAAVGAGLSDFLSGYALWVVPTMMIKALTVMMFSRKGEKILTKRNLLGLIPAAVICMAGYWVAGGILYGDFAAALADLPTNALQCAASIALFVPMSISLDKMSIKKRLTALHI